MKGIVLFLLCALLLSAYAQVCNVDSIKAYSGSTRTTVGNIAELSSFISKSFAPEKSNLFGVLPQANLLIVNEQQNCGCVSREVSRIARQFSANFDNEAQIYSISLSGLNYAKASMKRIAGRPNVKLIYWDADVQAFLSQDAQTVLAVDVASGESISQAKYINKLLEKLAAEQSETPQLFVLLSNNAAASEEITSNFATLFANRAAAEVVAATCNAAAVSTEAVDVVNMGRKLMGVRAWPWDNETAPINGTSPSDVEIADYQAQVWTWFIFFACILAAFYVMNSIDYSRDALVYATPN